MADASKLIAKSGEVVTCENGHRLYMITETIDLKTENWTSRFIAIRSWHPGLKSHNEVNADHINCPYCGKLWANKPDQSDSNSWELHVGTEWRSRIKCLNGD